MTAASTPSGARPSFAHASEAELARILDFYEVRWRYEPDTYPIGWNLDGDVVESFSPDFYLPDLELYLELTTLKQKLVRKKNRKLRRLRALYPDIRIKLFYAHDFRMLLLKFGRLALAEEMSGTIGQSTPPRAHDRPRDAGPSVPGIEPVAASAAADAGRVTDGPSDVMVQAPTGGPERVPFPPRGHRRGRRRRGAGAPAAVLADGPGGGTPGIGAG